MAIRGNPNEQVTADTEQFELTGGTVVDLGDGKVGRVTEVGENGTVKVRVNGKISEERAGEIKEYRGK